MVNEGADPIDADLVDRAVAAATSRSWMPRRASRNGTALETE